MKVLLDVNVVLDCLADREPFSGPAAGILVLAEQGSVRAYVAAHTVTTLFYLLARDLGAEVATFAVLDILDLVDVVTVDRKRMLQALAMDCEDFEDALQAACAIAIEADYLVTRDPSGFPPLAAEVILPEPFLVLHGASGTDHDPAGP